MKKNTGFWKGFVSALVLASLVAALGITAGAAANKMNIEVEPGIKLEINDARFTPKDANGKTVPVFLYNGTTYVPVRAISEATGMDVSFDSKTRTVHLTTPEQKVAKSSSSDDYITADEAREIARKDSGVKTADAVFLKTRLDYDDGHAVYDVEFYSKGVEYDYEINAVTGKIVEKDRDMDDFDAPDWDDRYDDDRDDRPAAGKVSQTTAPAEDYITADEAREIALDKAGGSARVVKLEFDRDDGRQVYEVELRSGIWEYEGEIDAVTGKILKWETDIDD